MLADIIYFVGDLSWMKHINPITALPEIIYFAGNNDSSQISQNVSCLIDYFFKTFPISPLIGGLGQG